MPPDAPSLNAQPGQVPPARILGNGSHWVLITAAGTGASSTGGYALTRWRGDRVADADGFFIYLRDRESGDFWSAGLAPAGKVPVRYAARSQPGIFAIAREDDGIEALLEVGVLPDAAAEIRRLTLHNRAARRRSLDITSFAEVVLHDPAAHEAHPVFSKLFVQTEYSAGERALLARRRPRAHGEHHPWLVHAVAADCDPEYETDRARFLGRGATLAAPAALRSRDRLSGSTGNVLDPILSLRCKIELAPGARTEVAFLLGAAPSRDGALALGAHLASGGQVGRLLAAAEAQARDRLRRLLVGEAEAEYWEALAGAMLYGHPGLRAAPGLLSRAHGDLAALGCYGLDPRSMLAVLHAEQPGGAALLPEVLTAYRYWQALGLPITLAVVTDDPGSVTGVPTSCASRLRVLRSRDVPPADLDRIDTLARLVLRDAFPALSAPAGSGRTPPERARPAARAATPLEPVEPPGAAEPPGADSLTFWNGMGGFDGTDYVIRLVPERDSGLRLPPRPWINVIANERFGLLVSETGAGSTWSANSRQHRLTPWSNDPLLDPHEEAFWVRDEETGEFWSPLPGPSPMAASYEMRHGLGVSTCRARGNGLEQETTLFVPVRDPLRVTAIRLSNLSARTRRFSVFAYYRLVLGTSPAESGRFIVTEKDGASRAVFARNRLSAEFGDAVVFSAVVAPPGAGGVHWTADRESFIGRRGDAAHPAALIDDSTLDGRTGAGLDPCIAEQVTLVLAPGESAAVAFLLGEAQHDAEARALVARYSAPGAIAEALAAARAFWNEGRHTLQIATPSPALDLMVNGWLPYQALSCRLWGRSALYQSGGAFGFRDQLQDAAALVTLWPLLTRSQILRHAAHQFPEGDVLHWWHPPGGCGIRTRCSDDLLWLPYLTAFYIETTGDWTILDQKAPFVTARLLAPGEDEAFVAPTVTAESADLYAHCCLALDHALTKGRHGLPLFGTGDWNDGMNCVGREGKGESVWLGFFTYAVLGGFLALCERRGDEERARRYRTWREELKSALNDAGWDGEWYRRGYYDTGEPLGSRTSDECRIDALAQAWAVISGAAPPERAALALDAVERHLVSEEEGLIRLLAPPFEHTTHDPGYIKGYVPGARENGGQYTHAALWVVRALAELGRNERAARLLQMLVPIERSRTPEQVGIYQVEPYVVAADIHGAPPHVGRGGWTWYTGSAGWMYRVAVESLLGFRLAGGRSIVLHPRVPAGWPGFTIAYSPPGESTRYDIAVTNPSRQGTGILAATIDGARAPIVEGAISVPIARDGRSHRVEIVLGKAE